MLYFHKGELSMKVNGNMMGDKKEWISKNLREIKDN